MDSLEEMRRAGAITAALARALGGKVTTLDPKPLVKVRVVYGRAVAVTPTHVLWEWVRYGEYHCRWDAKGQVTKVSESDQSTNRGSQSASPKVSRILWLYLAHRLKEWLQWSVSELP